MDTDKDGFIKVTFATRLCQRKQHRCCAADCSSRAHLPARGASGLTCLFRRLQGPEFKGVRETGYFHLPELPVILVDAPCRDIQLVNEMSVTGPCPDESRVCVVPQDLKTFGMKKDLFIKRCGLHSYAFESAPLRQ